MIIKNDIIQMINKWPIQQPKYINVSSIKYCYEYYISNISCILAYSEHAVYFAFIHFS